jgi:PPP family 3-phenylpropionic acid transporter
VNRIRLLYLLVGAAAGAYFPFTTNLLALRGLDALAIGVVSAVGWVAALLAAPALGHLADATLGRPRTLCIALMASAVTFAAFGTDIPAAAVLVSFVLFMAMVSAVTPMADALAVNALPLAERGGYGRIRLLMSGTYGLVAILTGAVAGAVGFGSAPFIAAGLLAAAGVAALRIPEARPSRGRGLPGARQGGSTRAALEHERALPALLLVLGVGVAVPNAVLALLPLRIEELGGSASAVGLSAGMEGIAELPGFLLASWVAANRGLRTLQAMGATLMGACLCAFALAPSPEAIVLVRLVIGLAYGATITAAVLTVGAVLPPTLQGTGQSLGTVAAGVISITSAAAGGAIYQAFGAVALFWTAGIVVALAAPAGWVILRRTAGRPA